MLFRSVRDAHVRILDGTRGLLEAEAETVPAAAVAAPTPAPAVETAPIADAAPVVEAAASAPAAETTASEPATTTTTATTQTATSTLPETTSAEKLDEVKVSVEITSAQAVFPVGRDYKVQYAEGKVEEGAGVWLQGCNEKTHGVSFTFFPSISPSLPSLLG